MAEILPEFQAEIVKGEFKRTVHRLVDDVKIVMRNGEEKRIVTRKIVATEETFNEGVFFWFPQKHSMLVAMDDTEQLQRIGYFRQPKLVDMDTGEIVHDGGMSLKNRVLAHERRHSPKGEFTLDEVMEG